MRIKYNVIGEAPTPHNNYFFSAIASQSSDDITFSYIYNSTAVPGRPWKSLGDGVRLCKVRTGISRILDFRLLWEVSHAGRYTVSFIIGWNHPILAVQILQAAVLRIPLLMWFDTPEEHPKPPSLRAWLRHFAKKIVVCAINRAPSIIFATGIEAAKRLESLGIQRRRIEVLPFFVPLPPRSADPTTSARQHIRRQLSCSESDLVVLSAGRLIRSKGFDILIEALAKLRQDGLNNWKLGLIGSGPELNNLSTRATHHGLDHAIHFVPWMEYWELQRAIAGCDIFVAPARFDPYPTTVLMAMTFRKPVVASDRTYSAVDFITPDESGMIFRSDDVDSLSVCLRKLLTRSDYSLMGDLASRSVANWPIERGVKLVRQCASHVVRMQG